MAIELQGKEISESDLILGERYWIIQRGDTYQSTICSGVFQGHRTILPMNMLIFNEAYYKKGKPYSFLHTIMYYRSRYPLQSMQQYYEIYTIHPIDRQLIQMHARHRFEKVQSKIIAIATNLPMDIAKHIAVYVNPSVTDDLYVGESVM